MIKNSLENVDNAISATNIAISLHDSLSRNLVTCRKTVAALESDIESIYRNDGGMNSKARANRLADLTSTRTIANCDLESAQRSVARQKAQSIANGKAAARALFDVMDALKLQRIANVAARLIEEFDWSEIRILRAQDIAASHKSVRALGNLGVSQLVYELEHDDDFSLKALRNLDAHWSELKPLAESEPGIELNIAAVHVSMITEPEPTAVGNQLGTLAVAVAA
jgi:hypothetical protein